MLFPKSMAKLKAYQERAKNLSPLQQKVTAVLVEGNRSRALDGVRPDGTPLPALAASTVRDRRRRGYPPGPPLVREGAGAEIVTAYRVTFESSAPGTLAVKAGWPGSKLMRYAIEGSGDRPARDPRGFSAEDRARLRALLRNHVLSGGS